MPVVLVWRSVELFSLITVCGVSTVPALEVNNTIQKNAQVHITLFKNVTVSDHKMFNNLAGGTTS